MCFFSIFCLYVSTYTVYIHIEEGLLKYQFKHLYLRTILLIFYLNYFIVLH